MTHAISTEQLTYTYGSRRGIENVSLSIPAGSLYGFLGPNGAGKTTTIRILLGFLHATHGRASIFGKECWSSSAVIKRDVGYVPGDMRLWPWLNGHSAVKLFSSVRGIDLRSPAKKLADLFELDLNVPVRRMSKGMRQKLGLILAMAHDPQLLILDEPSSGLDPLMQDRLLEHLRACASRGRTVFFSSHTLSEVERLCDRLAIVRKGKIVFDGQLNALQQQAGHELALRLKPGATLQGDPPAELRVTDRSTAHLAGHYSGNLDHLLAWLARQQVEDVSISRPELEDLFREFYQDDAAATATTGGRQ